MNEIIYDTRDEAALACKVYVDAIRDLQEKLGVFETCDDSCVQIYVNAKWRCEDGKIDLYERDTEMLSAIVKYRGYMWT
jgi:hypothetical protein